MKPNHDRKPVACSLHAAGVLSLLAILATPILEGQSIVIGTLDSSRNGPASVEDGVLTASLRQSLQDHAEELGFEEISILGAPELDEGLAGRVDILILHNVFDGSHEIHEPLSDAEQTVMVEFVRDGGAAIILADGGFWDTAPAFVEPFGVVYGHHTKGTDLGVVLDQDPPHPIVDGPFGRTSTLRTFWAGWFEDTGPWADPIATLGTNGQPSLAVIDADRMEPGSGRAVLMTDTSAFGDSTIDPDLYFDEHEALFLNTMAWLIEDLVVPSGGPVFKRGDVDANGILELTDAVNDLEFQFLGTFQPLCRDAHDFDDNGLIEVTDAINSLGHQFLGDPPPPAPGASRCGEDPTPDGGEDQDRDLGCEAYPEGSCD